MTAARTAALGAHAFEPSDVGTRLDRAGRPIRICRICGRPGRGSGHRFGGLTPTPPALRLVEKATWNETRPTRSAPPPPDPTPTVVGRHPFDPDPGGQMIIRPGPHGPSSWVACAVCGKDRRAHPRRSRTNQDDAQAAPVAVMAADIQNGSGARPGPSGAVPAKRRGPALPAAELVALGLAVDRILALPIDLVGWKLRMRLVSVREVLAVPEYPTLDVAELPGEVDPDPTTDAILATRPEMAPRPRPVDPAAASRSLLSGIRNDRVRTLAQRAVQAGGKLSMTGSGHLAIDVGGQRLIVSTTMGDGRRGHSWGNARAAAKRAGIDVTGL